MAGVTAGSRAPDERPTTDEEDANESTEHWRRTFPQDAIMDSTRMRSICPNPISSTKADQSECQVVMPSLPESAGCVKSGLQLSAQFLAARSLPIRAVRCLCAAFRGGRDAVGELFFTVEDAALNVEQVVMHVSQEAVQAVASARQEGVSVIDLLEGGPDQAPMDFLQIQRHDLRADGTQDFHISLVYCALAFAGQLTLSSTGAVEPSLLYLGTCLQ
jgi:hypothetical protein